MLELTYHGHSCFTLAADGARVIVDPFLNGNQHTKLTPADVRVDAVLVSHGHGDHVGDALEIAKENACPIIANFEISNWFGAKGVDVHPMHIGGAHTFTWGRVKLVPAVHGSLLPDGSDGGVAAGFIVWMGGKAIYYAGDTALTSDMELYGKLYPTDLALLPIGDNFTMGVDDALEAAALCGAKEVAPIHYNTFDMIPADPREFVEKAKARGIKARVLSFDDTITLK